MTASPRTAVFLRHPRCECGRQYVRFAVYLYLSPLVSFCAPRGRVGAVYLRGLDRFPKTGSFSRDVEF